MFHQVAVMRRGRVFVGAVGCLAAMAGAQESHWAFLPLPAKIEVPAGDGAPIDRFVRAAWAERGVLASGAAPALRWLRRVAFDLTGLPPTLAQIERLGGDDRPEVRASLVDEMLASRAFGEAMARPWLDAARYADSYGYQSDQLSPTWPYRDWVVRAFNSNLPYDAFLTWQIAGDLLPEATREQRLATAFNRLHRMTNEGGSIEQEWRNEYVADRVHTMGTAVLGLTLECARCHDHKTDPITQREYYSLHAYFNSIDEWGMYHDSSRVPTPALLLPTAEQEERGELLQRAADAAALRYAKAVGVVSAGRPATDPIAHYDPGAAADNGQVPNLARGRPGQSGGNQRVDVDGRRGLRLSGDDAVQLPGLGRFPMGKPFVIEFDLWLPEGLDDAILCHRSGGTDVGYHGVEVRIMEGRPEFRWTRFWPGNALAVRGAPLPRESWFTLRVAYDGTLGVEGMALAVVPGAGEADAVVERIVVRDRMTKLPQHGGDGLAIGERFRDTGLVGAVLGEVRIWDRVASTAADGAEAEQARATLSGARHALFRERTGWREISVMEDMPEARPAFLLARGDYDAPVDDADRARRVVPAALGSPEVAPADRLALARWLTAPDHPLTARVAVNRFWHHFFGRGLVPTVGDFGVAGDRPTHADLLDWVARDFVDGGWDVKALCRAIVLSEAYGRDSRGDRSVDPDNVWLGRGPSRRLSAEALRDLALDAAGVLDRALGGAPVSPYQPANYWRQANSMSPGYRQSVGADLYRRSLYTVWKRTAPMPNMVLLDAPGREVACARRQPTSTPLQALVLLNDVQFAEAARLMGARAWEDAGEGGVEVAIDMLLRRLAGRPAERRELRVLGELFDACRAEFAADIEAAKAVATVGAAEAVSLDPADAAAMAAVAQAAFNLDATVWLR